MTEETKKFVGDMIKYLAENHSYKGFNKSNLEAIFLRTSLGELPHQKFPVGAHVFVNTIRLYSLNKENTEKHHMTHIINDELYVLGIITEYNYLLEQPYKVMCFYKNSSDPEFYGEQMYKSESDMILVSEVLENPFVD